MNLNKPKIKAPVIMGENVTNRGAPKFYTDPLPYFFRDTVHYKELRIKICGTILQTVSNATFKLE